MALFFDVVLGLISFPSMLMKITQDEKTLKLNIYVMGTTHVHVHH